MEKNRVEYIEFYYEWDDEVKVKVKFKLKNGELISEYIIVDSPIGSVDSIIEKAKVQLRDNLNGEWE